jgi:hypothetical protein
MGQAQTRRETITAFKIGDKVRYVASANGNKDWNGGEFEVTELNVGWTGKNLKLEVTKASSYMGEYHHSIGKTVILSPENLELIKQEPKFKVGDRVQPAAGYENYYSSHKGRTDLTVQSLEYGGNYVSHPDSAHKYGLFYRDEMLELVPEPVIEMPVVGEEVEFVEGYLSEDKKVGDRVKVCNVTDPQDGNFALVWFRNDEGFETGVYRSRVKLVKPLTLADYTVGDTVKLTATGVTSLGGAHKDEVGTVVEITRHYLRTEFESATGTKRKWLMNVSEVEPYTPEPKEEAKVETFKYEDIQVGDTIRRTEKYGITTTITEGVAHRKGYSYWDDVDSNAVAYEGDDNDTSVTLELVNRPEPEPKPEPKVWEGAETGDQIIVDKLNSTRVLTKHRDGHWTSILTFRDKDTTARKGFSYNDHELDTVLKSATNKPRLIKA